MINQPHPYVVAEGKLLVIGIDVGTTLSGMSYALLEPGKVPQIQPVTRFSGQREENAKSKVCSVVCYDRVGDVIAAGSETDLEVNPMLPEIEGVRRAEWLGHDIKLLRNLIFFSFKLGLWPTRDNRREKIWPSQTFAEEESKNNSPLGIEQAGEGKLEGGKESRSRRGGSEGKDLWAQIVERQHLNKRMTLRPVTDDFKTPVQVFTDFLQYLFKSAKEHIITRERNLDPIFTWSSVERNTYFVLTHPNGWGENQLSQMRDAAVAAGLVNRATAAEHINFVTEGKAGLHFCLDKNPELRQERGGLLMVDCGGGIIDLSAYSQIGKGYYRQIVSSDCLRQGSSFVTSRARDYFKGKFKDSQFGSDCIIEAMTRAFDKPDGIKCMFRCPNRPYFVKFGGLRDNDQKYGVLGGKFKVEGAQMAKFFEPAIQGIIDGIANQCKDGVSIKYVLLVGGFARSQYLYQKLSEYFTSRGVVILRPDISHQNKAAADGAVSWYLNRYVSTHSYSVMTRHLFNPTDPDNLNRESATRTTANTGGSRGQAACLKHAFTLKRTEPSSKQLHTCNDGQKLPGTTREANERPEKPSTVDDTSQARRRVNHGTREIGTGPQDSDCRSKRGKTARLKVEDAGLTHHRGHTRGKDRHASMKGVQLCKLSSFAGKSDMISVADVTELVRILNTQTERESSFIPDSLSYRNSAISTKELEDVLDEFTSYIGSSLCNDFRSQLNNPNIGPDPLITKLVLRSALAKARNCITNNGALPPDGATLSRTHGKWV